MISLVFFPLLCVVYLYQTKAFQSQSAIQLIVWNKYDAKRIKEMDGWEGHPKRNYLEICLTGHDEQDQMNLDKAQSAFRRMVRTKDTTFGVHLDFKDDAHYWTLVSALDRLDIENVQYFIVNKNHLWVFHNIPKPYVEDTTLKHPLIIPFCGNSAAGFYDNKAQERATKLKEKEGKYLNLLKQFWGPGILFFIVVSLVIL